MEIKEEKVTQTVKTYTFTEDEYHELIYNQRKYGGITQFIKDLLDYLKNGYRMNNMYDLSFNEWIKKNR